MPVAYLNDHIFDRGKKRLEDIINWLDKNVGEYYGIGEHPVMRIGSGWEIRSEEELVSEGISISWVVDITDEKKFMLYVLTWGA